ncbi:MAG: YitT family protein, partial [Firmicutes bacterium]|nr:YitT family protein [Bacillota bacterium]
INVLMLIVGFVALGKEFAMTTLASTFLFPAMLEVCQRLFGGIVLTDDLVLCTLFSGLWIGIAMGIVIRTGTSTGGMDIPPMVLRKYFRIPMAVSMYFFDVCILLSQATFRKAENVLYGIVLVLIYTIVLDKVLVMGSSRLEIKVISEHAGAIRDAIIQQMDRGVTMLHGEGGYMQDEKQIVMSIISNRELNRMEKLVHAVDPESFLIISSVKEVSGRGFSLGKKYQ